MNWLHKLSQSKPMALPYAIEEEKGFDPGTLRIDSLMSPETAFEQGKSHPDLDFFGAGALGLVSKTGIPGVLVKYTPDKNEVNAAQIQFEKKFPFFIEVLQPPKQIQQDPPLWEIMIREIKQLTWPAVGFVTYLHRSYQSKKMKYPTLKEALDDWDFQMRRDDIRKAYDDYTNLLKEMISSGIWVGDAHGENVGYQNGELVVLDLGGYEEAA